MPYTNGQLVNTGCVADGVRGWYAGQRVIEEAQGLGWELDAEGQALVDLYYGGSAGANVDEYEYAADIVTQQGGILDDAEQWLNDNTPPCCPTCGEPVEWVNSGWWRHVHGIGPGRCGLRFMDTVQHYTWHWHHGSFSLSRICDNEEECDDDECAHYD